MTIPEKHSGSAQMELGLLGIARQETMLPEALVFQELTIPAPV